MKRGEEIEVGDLVEVPAGKKGSVTAAVLYVSSHFKDVILLGFCELQVGGGPCRLSDQYFYTEVSAIKRGRWKLIKNGYAAPVDPSVSTRIVGGEVWTGDQKVRDATSVDRKDLPKMRVAGPVLMERRAEEYLSIR